MQRGRVISATKPFKVEVTKQSVENAVPGDMTSCVLACAIKEAAEKAGQTLLHVQVGPQRTILKYVNRDVIYRTPEVVAQAFPEYDKSGKWDIPLGEVSLKPLPKSLRPEEQRKRAADRRAAGDPNMAWESSDKPKKSRHLTSIRFIVFRSKQKQATAKQKQVGID